MWAEYKVAVRRQNQKSSDRIVHTLHTQCLKLIKTFSLSSVVFRVIELHVLGNIVKSNKVEYDDDDDATNFTEMNNFAELLIEVALKALPRRRHQQQPKSGENSLHFFNCRFSVFF